MGTTEQPPLPQPTQTQQKVHDFPASPTRPPSKDFPQCFKGGCYSLVVRTGYLGSWIAGKPWRNIHAMRENLPYFTTGCDILL